MKKWMIWGVFSLFLETSIYKLNQPLIFSGYVSFKGAVLIVFCFVSEESSIRLKPSDLVLEDGLGGCTFSKDQHHQ